jgi:GT2 family glycosyltransferase
LNVVGIVAIGRNEGDRLIACLRSAIREVPRAWVVYVDSGSSDHSLKNARELGIATIELNSALPFTAARARNAGFEELRAAQPGLEFVQFIDGDCELADGWLEAAERFLAQRPNVAVVCGRRRERYPERSYYNWLCDQEWDTPIGEAQACGGDALLRVEPFERVGGFRPSLIAAEDTELCLRVREHGWKIWRLDVEMTVHDVAITRFGQWWTRIARGGYGYADVFQLHKSSPMRIFQTEIMRAIFWGGILPLLVVSGGILNKLAFAGVLLYPAQICRIAFRRGATHPESWKFATFMMLAKFAELKGLAHYHWSRWRRKIPTSFGYKDVV